MKRHSNQHTFNNSHSNNPIDLATFGFFNKPGYFRTGQSPNSKSLALALINQILQAFPAAEPTASKQ